MQDVMTSCIVQSLPLTRTVITDSTCQTEAGMNERYLAMTGAVLCKA